MSISKQVHEKFGLVLIIIVAVQLLTIALVVKNDSDLNNNKKSVAMLNRGLEQLSPNAFDRSLAAQPSSQRAVVNPVEAVVYIPEFHIKLPLNEITKTIAYNIRSHGSDSKSAIITEADVSSTLYIQPPTQTRIDCSDYVRLKLEPKASPYNPHEESSTVVLSDSRVLQIYELVNEKECQTSWANSLSPSALAAEFKQAQVY